MNHNVAAHLAAHAERQPKRAALIAPGRAGDTVVTFAELNQRVDALAWGLSRRGVVPGDRVVVMLPMSIDLYVLLIALLKLGAVAVFLDPWVGLAQLDCCCRLVEPKGFIGIAVTHVLRLLSSHFRRIPLHLVARSGRQALAANADGPFPCFEASADRPALVTFTTGSTGTPKGANRTHGFLWAQHVALAEELDQRAGDVDMPAFPIMLLNNLAGGVTSVMPDMHPARPAKVDAAKVVAQIRRHGVTTASGSPAFWQRIATWCQDRGEPLETLRRVHTGGAPVGPETVALLTKALPNGEVHVVYGSTEAEPVAAISGREILGDTAARTRQGAGTCVGRPAPVTRVKIIRHHDGPIALSGQGWAEWEMPPGQIGEVVVSGDHVGRGYWRNPDAERRHKIAEGERIWHRMDDLGYLDDQGWLWLVGRGHNAVPRAGTLYYPFQIEPIALAAPQVRQAALVGLPDHELGQRCVLVVAGSADAAAAAVREAGFPVDEVVSRRTLPVDPRHNAKIDYARLRRDLSR